MIKLVIVLLIAMPLNAQAKTYSNKNHLCKVALMHQSIDDVFIPAKSGLKPDMDLIKIPLTIDLAERYGIDLPAGAEMQADLGMIELYNSGMILYNGEDIRPKIQKACNEQ